MSGLGAQALAGAQARCLAKGGRRWAEARYSPYRLALLPALQAGSDGFVACGALCWRFTN
jgi:hypothetical protein